MINVLPGVWTSDQWKVPSCCWIQCSLGSRRHTHENKQSYVNPVIIDPLSSSLGNTSHALAPSPSDWLVSQRTVCKMYSIIINLLNPVSIYYRFWSSKKRIRHDIDLIITLSGSLVWEFVLWFLTVSKRNFIQWSKFQHYNSSFLSYSYYFFIINYRS